jgi:hypothetical protein
LGGIGQRAGREELGEQDRKNDFMIVRKGEWEMKEIDNG